jgi:alkylation response protein AidB-like acyl-CoA dehydrogenase
MLMEAKAFNRPPALWFLGRAGSIAARRARGAPAADDLLGLLLVIKGCRPTGLEAAVNAQQICGHGYVREWGWSSSCDARIAQIYEGTSGIQARPGQPQIGANGNRRPRPSSRSSRGNRRRQE